MAAQYWMGQKGATMSGGNPASLQVRDGSDRYLREQMMREYARKGGTYSTTVSGRPGAPTDKYAWAGAADAVNRVTNPTGVYNAFPNGLEKKIRDEDIADQERRYQERLQRSRDEDERDRLSFAGDQRSFSRDLLKKSRSMLGTTSLSTSGYGRITGLR